MKNITSDFAVETERLTKTFGKIKAVDSVSLKIRRGEIFGLIGPNGAGKTTFIRLLIGLLRPDSGNGRILGCPIDTLTPEVKRKIGYMPQSKSLYPDLTAKENIEFFARLNGLLDKEIRGKHIENVIRLVEIEKWANMVVSELSGGTQQRVSLACAIVHDPDLLLLDEPTVGISPNLRKSFWNYFKSLTERGKTIIVTTHYLEEAINCDRIALMHNGKILAVGTVSEIMSLLPHGKSLVLKLGKKIEEGVIEKLTSLFDVSVTITGELNISIGYSDDSIVGDVISFLKKNNILIKSVEIRMPSLDDVFIYLIRRQNENIFSEV